MSQNRTSTITLDQNMPGPFPCGRHWVMIVLLSAWLGTACAPVPILSGSHATLPPTSGPLIVWGNHPAIVTAATSWLQGRGYTLIERAAIQALLEDPIEEGTVEDVTEANVLRAAKTLNVDQVVFVHRSGDIRAPLVSARGIDVQSHRVDWNGYGHYQTFVTEPFSHLLVSLTCQALAKAWGVPIEDQDQPCMGAVPQ